MGDPIPGSIEYDAEKGFKEKCEDSNSKAVERAQVRGDDTRVIEVFSVLSDKVANEILSSIAESGECTRKDLEILDAVVKEGALLVRKLRECGLIAVEKDTIALTEKGRKVLAFIDRARNDELIRG